MNSALVSDKSIKFIRLAVFRRPPLKVGASETRPPAAGRNSARMRVRFTQIFGHANGQMDHFGCVCAHNYTPSHVLV